MCYGLIQNSCFNAFWFISSTQGTQRQAKCLFRTKKFVVLTQLLLLLLHSSAAAALLLGGSSSTPPRRQQHSSSAAALLLGGSTPPWCQGSCHVLSEFQRMTCQHWMLHWHVPQLSNTTSPEICNKNCGSNFFLFCLEESVY